MNTGAVQIWLKQKRASGATARVLLGIVTLIAGMVVVFLTFWFTYAVVWIIFEGVSAFSSLTLGRNVRLTHEWRLAMSAVFVGLLFLQHIRTSPWHWGEYPKRNDYSLVAGHVLGPWALLRYPGASANMIADILLSGPRLVFGFWSLVQEANRLRRLDVQRCGQLLTFLASRPTAVAYEELHAAGWESWFAQLRCIEGVVFLEKGLTLTAELRNELARLSAH